MGDEERRTDDEDEDLPLSTLPEEEAAREAQRAIAEIEADEPLPPPRHQPPKSQGPAGPSFIEKAWDRQYKIETRLRRIGRGRYSRVLKMARKPEHDEFVRASQITAIGIAVIGLIGFAILLLMTWFWDLIGVQ